MAAVRLVDAVCADRAGRRRLRRALSLGEAQLAHPIIPGASSAPARHPAARRRRDLLRGDAVREHPVSAALPADRTRTRHRHVGHAAAADHAVDGDGRNVTGRLVSRTGKVTIFPIVGLSLATASLIALGATISFAPDAVVLATHGTDGGRARHGDARHAGRRAAGGGTRVAGCCDRLDVAVRSVGGAIGVAIAGAIIFVSIGARTIAAMYAVLQRVMGGGPGVPRPAVDGRARVDQRAARSRRSGSCSSASR